MKQFTLAHITFVTNELVNDYFKELKPIIIILREESDQDYYAKGNVYGLKREFILHIDDSIYDLPANAIKGCLAYEFARIKKLHSLDHLGLFLYRVKKMISRNYRINVERELTKTMIEKDLGLELFEFRHHNQKGNYPYVSSDFMQNVRSVARKEK